MPTTPEMKRRVAHVVEEFQIEHGITMPQVHRGLANKILLTMVRMQPPNGDGKPRDSFLIPFDTKDRNRLRGVHSSTSYAARLLRREHPDWEFSTRTVEGGIRCWRVR